MISVSLLNFSYCFYTVPEFTDSSVFSCISLSFFQTIILNTFLENSQTSISSGSVAAILLHCFGVVMFPCSFMFLMVCVDICAFEGEVTSTSFFKLALVRKVLYLDVAVGSSTEWDAVSLVHEKAQWWSLHAIPLGEIEIGQSVAIFTGKCYRGPAGSSSR